MFFLWGVLIYVILYLKLRRHYFKIPEDFSTKGEFIFKNIINK